jgi:hypothetical protein
MAGSTSAVEQKSSENNKPQENACHHERHLSGIALKVYNLFWRLAKKSKSGSVSLTNQKIAKLIGAKASERADHITRVKTALVRGGLLEFLGVSRGPTNGTWRGGRYQPVSHEDWVEVKASELGYSPCHPTPLQIKVSSVKPGGRSFQRKAPKRAPLREPEVRTVAPEKRPHGAWQEVRADLRAGSTHGLRSGKYTQSVDFNPAVDVDFPQNGKSQSVDAKSAIAPSKAFKEEGTSSPLPCEPTPEKQQQQQSFWKSQQVEAWRVLERWGVGSDEGDELFRECWRIACLKAGERFSLLRSRTKVPRFVDMAESLDHFRDVGRLLEVMNEVIELCKKRVIDVPACFREAWSRVDTALEVEWQQKMHNLAEQKRKLLDKYSQPLASA